MGRVKGEKQKYGGMFNDELDAARRANQLCQEFGVPLQNPTISGIPNQRYQGKEKTSQYKGVYWHKNKRKWCAFVYLKGQNQKYCGGFDNELDAARKVNELCQDFGIPLHNPSAVEMPIQVSSHDHFQSSANPVISVDIVKTDDNDVNNKKRKHEKEFNNDDKLPVETNYFYDYLLKQ